MTYVVKWEQWRREGPHGDDIDCEDMEMEFPTMAMAENFVEALVAGVHRGLGDMKVRHEDIKLFSK